MLAGLGADAVVVVVMILTGAIVGAFGYRIRYYGDVHLIAGYRSDVPTDTEALSRAAGRATLAIAAVTMLAGSIYPVLHLRPTTEVVYWVGYIVIVLSLSGYIVFIANQTYIIFN